MNYRREIDGLRALAVLPVILFHAGFEVFSGGFVGVDIFFVISGYLITTIILTELEQGKFSIVNFYERRARRILPALFLVMLVCIPFAWHWLLPSDMKDFCRSLVAVSLFASNFLFWHESGYFDTASELKPLLHTWSLAVEEQYYVIFPLFLMISWRLGKQWILALLATVFISSLAVAQWSSIAKPATAFFLLPTRGWELLLGAFTAFYLSQANRHEFGRALREVFGWLGLGLITFSIFIYNKNTPFPGFYALAPTVGTALIILFATQATTIGKFIGNRVFVGLGLISYSAYLWHQPLFAMARHRILGEPSWHIFILLSAAALILAYFSWRFVELPFRDKLRFTRKSIFLLALILSIFFIFFGSLGYNKGFEHRFNRELVGDVDHAEFHKYIDDKFHDCEPKTIAKQALRWESHLRCKQSKKGIPDVVLLGDSHAEHLFLGLAEYKPDLNISFYILDGNPYISNPQFNNIFNELLNNQKPQHIVLTMYYLVRLDSAASGLYEGFAATIKALKDAGKTVSLVGNVPSFHQNPGYCVYALPSKKLSSSCYITIDEAKRQSRVYHSLLEKLSKEYGVTYIDIAAPLCTDTRCAMTNDGAVLYRDKNHLNILGSKLIGRYIHDIF